MVMGAREHGVSTKLRWTVSRDRIDIEGHIASQVLVTSNPRPLPYRWALTRVKIQIQMS